MGSGCGAAVSIHRLINYNRPTRAFSQITIPSKPSFILLSISTTKMFRHRNPIGSEKPGIPDASPATASEEVPRNGMSSQDANQGLFKYNHNGHLVTKHIHPDGESGRKGVHPIHFLKICFRSSCTASKYVNFLWPFVPPAIALHFARPEAFNWIFALNYVAIIPTANLIGFAGQELARKLPKVFGLSMEKPVKQSTNIR